MPPPLTTIFLLKSPSLPTDPYTTSFPPTLYSTPIHIPPLITTLHPIPLIALLSSPSSLLDYSAWIFTSQRAVRSLILAFEQHQKLKRVSDEWKREIREKYRIPLFAVGPGTAGALEREVIGGGGGGGGGWMGACRVEGGGDAGRGEKLVPIIVSRCNMEDEDVLQREEWVGGKGKGKEKEKEKEKEEEVEGDEGEKTKKKKKKVLWLTGEKRREALRTGLEDAGIEVDCCIVYSTSLSPDFLPSFLQALCKQQQQQQQRLDEQQQQLPSERRRRDKKSSGNYDDDEEEEEGVRWVLVFSTQGSREILIALDWLDEKTGRVKRGFDEQGEERRTFVASIGGTTAGYLEEEFGFTVDVVAERPSPEGVREGIEAFMRRRGLLL